MEAPNYNEATDAAAAVTSNFFNIHEVGRVTIATIEASTIRERQAMRLREELLGMVQSSRGLLAVCMRDVEYITSSFLAALVEISGKCAKAGGRLVLYQVQPKIQSDMRACGAVKHLRIASSLGEASAMVMESQARAVARGSGRGLLARLFKGAA
ncbi:MAG: STAS domain-containing protein [Phycisphaerae bacterium]|nr:STAS domain-containing protein [Phycisphaerae bacterium]